MDFCIWLTATVTGDTLSAAWNKGDWLSMDSCLELYYKILMFVFMSIMKIFKVVYMREKWQLFKKYSNSNPILVFLWKCLIYMLNLIISCVHLRRYLWSSLLTNENMCSACVHRFFFPENIKNKNKSNRSRENISNKICLEQSLKTYSAHFFVFWSSWTWSDSQIILGFALSKDSP